MGSRLRSGEENGTIFFNAELFSKNDFDIEKKIAIFLGL